MGFTKGLHGVSRVLVEVHLAMGSHTDAMRMARTLVDAAQKTGNQVREKASWVFLVNTCNQAGDFDDAKTAGKEGLERLVMPQDWKVKVDLLLGIASAYWLQHAEVLDEAVALTSQANTLCTRNGYKAGERACLELLTEMRIWRGEVPPNSDFRRQALEHVRDIGKAVDANNLEEFTTRLGKLENLQGFSRFDLDQVLMPAFSRYPDRASEFVRAYAEVLQIEGGARPVREALGLQDEEKSDVDLTQTWEGVPKKLAYFMHRVNGMGFGPQFQTVQASYRGKTAHNTINSAIMGIVQVPDESEAWEEYIETHPGLIDAAVHSQVAHQCIDMMKAHQQATK